MTSVANPAELVSKIAAGEPVLALMAATVY
jgi:hypothetical protein